MKYIRTKDGIYSLEKATICRYKNKEYVCPIRREETFEEHRSREHHFIGLKWEVIKISDTIEELCDEFIIVGYTTIPKRCDIGTKKLFEDKSKYLTVELSSYGERYGYDLTTFQKTKPNCCIYGAIWTGWGLKYVAKMNDKGELELL